MQHGAGCGDLGHRACQLAQASGRNEELSAVPSLLALPLAARTLVTHQHRATVALERGENSALASKGAHSAGALCA